jgi:hypothetical protein
MARDLATSPADGALDNATDSPTLKYSTSRVAWRAGAGEVVVQRGAFSGTSIYTFAVPARMRRASLRIRGMKFGLNTSIIYARFSIDNGATYISTASYTWAGVFGYSVAIGYLGNSAGGTQIQLSGQPLVDARGWGLLDIDIEPGGGANPVIPLIRWRMGHPQANGSGMFLTGMGILGNNTTRITNLQLFASPVGNFSGDFSIAGVP